MKWNLRLAAAQREIWMASDLKRLLAERGLVMSAGKMSGLWSGQPVSLKLDDLDVICAVLGCEVGELLIPEPDKVPPSGRTHRCPTLPWRRSPAPSPAAATVEPSHRPERSWRSVTALRQECPEPWRTVDRAWPGD